jgi:hypothetical protein
MRHSFATVKWIDRNFPRKRKVSSQALYLWSKRGLAEFKKSTGIQEFVATVTTLVEQIAGVTLTVTIGE